MIRFFVFCSLLLPAAAMAQAKKAAPKANSSAVSAAVTRGKTVYTNVCLACHQADGSGVPNLNPPLLKTPWVLGNKPTLIGMVLNGSQGKVEIDGEKFNNNMPSLSYLSDQEIADVLTYVRNSFGNKASIVTPAEVKAVRAKAK